MVPSERFTRNPLDRRRHAGLRYAPPMAVGIFNVVIGIAMIGGGLSKSFTLLGTNSWEALVGLGVVIAGLGVYQIVQTKRGR